MAEVHKLEQQSHFRFTFRLPDGDEAVYSAAASNSGVAFSRLYADMADPTPFNVIVQKDDCVGESHETICRRAINQAFLEVLFLHPMNVTLDKYMREWNGKLIGS